MAQIKNFGLAGVANDVQFGKAGPRLIQAGGVFSLRNAADNAFARLQIADPSLGSDAVHKSYVDAGITAIQSELDLTQTSVGLSANGSLPSLVGSYISASASIKAAVEALDAALVTEVGARIAGDASLAGALTAASLALSVQIASASSALSSAITAVDGRVTDVFGSFTAFESAANGSFAAIGTTLTAHGATLTDHAVRIAALETGNSAVQDELDFTQGQIGLGTDGAFTPLGGTFGINATTVVGALGQLQTALGGVDNNLSAVETAAGLNTDGSLSGYNAGATILTGATTLKGGIEAAATFAQNVDANLTAVEGAVGLGADGSLAPFTGTMIAGATTIAGAILALRDAADGRFDAAETELSRLNSTLTANYIHRDGSVAMTGALNLGGNRVTNLPVQAPTDTLLATTDAASIGYVNGRIAQLAGAFQYEGTLALGTVSAEATILTATWDAGSYFKVANSGYYSFDGSGTVLFANANDGLVRNSGTGWDKIDNTDSTVQGTPLFIDVQGTTDSGFVVDLDAAFKTRMVNAETSIGTLSTGLAATQGSLVAVDGRLVNAEASIVTLSSGLAATQGSLVAVTTRMTTAEGSIVSLTASVTSEISRVDGSIIALTDFANGSLTALTSFVTGSLAAVTSVNATQDNRLTTLEAQGTAVAASITAMGVELRGSISSVETAVYGSLANLTTFTNGSLTALTTYVAGEVVRLDGRIDGVNTNLSSVETSVGLDVDGLVPSGAFTGSYMSSPTSVIAAINQVANGAGSAIATEVAARAAADLSLQTELDATQTAIGLSGTAGTALTWATSAPVYLSAATSVVGGVEAVANALSNLSQDEIRSASGNTRVRAASTQVEMYAPSGSGSFLAMTVEALANADSTMALVATAGEVQMVAEGSPSNINIRLIPKGTGQVFIGSEGAAAGTVSAEPGEDLIITGGNNSAGTAGDLILRAGDGSVDGIVAIQSGSATDVARFFGNGPSSIEFTTGTTTVGFAAAGTGDVDIVIDPLGSGRLDVSNAVIANVATPTVGTDGANKSYVDNRVATELTSAFVGAVRTRTATLTAAGSAALGTIVGTVLRVKASVTSAFGAAQTLRVGVSGSTEQLAADSESDLATSGLYMIEAAQSYTVATPILAEIVGSGTGSVVVVVEYLQG